ncbi:hypothetical protein [Glycomyces tenuis]|uniref:hypothetical protein n=1 Tax=Glycomyces tenuis TaxID=58116 RepID=UPI00047E1A9C|nr:hypothetical protein [Glycomyces tenuis]
MYGNVYCSTCGQGFDAYEFSLPNGMCERCEQLRELEPAQAGLECRDCGDALATGEASESGLCAICEWEFITDLMTCNARIRSGECGQIACDACPVAEVRGDRV